MLRLVAHVGELQAEPERHRQQRHQDIRHAEADDEVVTDGAQVTVAVEARHHHNVARQRQQDEQRH